VSADIVAQTITSIPLALVDASPTNPRKHFDKRELAELTASVRDRGILQPILVRPSKEGRYEIVAGERRSRAATAAGLSEIPVVVRELGDEEAREIQIIENGQRVDLSPLEESETYFDLTQRGYDVHRIAKAVSRKRQTSHAGCSSCNSIRRSQTSYATDGYQ